MKKRLIIILFALITKGVIAQDEKNKESAPAPIEFTVDSTSVLTLGKTIKTLYAVISGEKGAKRNWKQFKYLFKPDAKLIPSGKNKAGVFQVNYMSPEEYIKSSSKWFASNGFYEKEILRRVEYFGNIVHAFSSYECFHTETDKEPFMRGINSIQLLNDGTRWWIVNIYWTQETKDNPIPEVYLKR
ncbi:hypothetical protein [Algibacter mikhailovii]|uniref:hypothetical protein n=1 Tax=Algibacter mikhailovii TaxID=425498 RepID=UPI0024952DD9|nr:hypothetical protein [Algibacter mikhailovii]